MALDRSLIIRAPAIVQYGGVTVWTSDDIVCTPQLEHFDVGTSIHGPQADRRLVDVRWEISFTPVVLDHFGWLEAVYLPFTNYGSGIGPGGSVFGATDKPLVIWAKNGNRKYTFASAMALRPGDLTLAANKPVFGSTTFTALRKNNTAWSAADSLLKVETAAFPTVAFPGKDAMVRNFPVSFAVGGVDVFSFIDTLDGVTFRIAPNVQPVSTDAMGVVDYTLSNVGLSASFTPAIPLDVLSLMKVQGNPLAGSGITFERGVSVQDFGEGKLTLADAAEEIPIQFYLEAARLVSGLNQFGSTAPLVGQMTFEARWGALAGGAFSWAEL